MPDLSIETRRLAVENAAEAATLLLPRFDPALGTLLGVRVRIDGVVTASLAVENMEARATKLAVTMPAGLMLQLPSGATIASAGSHDTVPLATRTLAAFDGAADFDGASGVQLTGLTADFSNTESRFDTATLAALAGTGEAELTLTGNLWLRASSGANARLLSDGDLGAAITVEYGYVPAGTPVGNPGDWGFSSDSTFVIAIAPIFTLPPPVQIVTAAQVFVFADRTTGWHDSFNATQFDPARGTLQSVEIRLIGNIAGGAAIENHGAAAIMGVSQSAGLTLTWADGTPTPLSAKADLNWNPALGASDGSDDFAGPGGWTSSGQAATGRTTLTILDAAAGVRSIETLHAPQVPGTAEPVTLKDHTDLARFLGTGTVALGLDSIGSGTLSGTTADLLAQLQARGGAQVEVRYTYLPADPANVVGGPGDTITYGNYTTEGDINIAVGAGGRLELMGAISARNITITSADDIGYLNQGTIITGSLTQITNGLLGLTDAVGGGCSVTDTRTNTEITVTPTTYAGPVTGLDHELIRITAENLNVTPATDNWFIRTGAGTDAIAAHGGTNVLDGGGGSNFLTGAAGQDTFFLDARTAADAVWSTVVAFGADDAVTIWGLAEAGTTLAWLDDQGAPGATGLTLHASAAGRRCRSPWRDTPAQPCPMDISRSPSGTTPQAAATTSTCAPSDRSNRPIARQGDPVHRAQLAVIVVDWVVQRAAIIPDRQRPRAPLKAAGELRPNLMIEQKPQQRRALLHRHVNKPQRMRHVDIKRLSPGLRMRPHHRMRRLVQRLCIVALAVAHTVLARPRHIRLGRRRNANQPIQQPLHPDRQRLVCQIHTGKKRVPAMARHLARHQHRCRRRHFEIAGIGVPDAAEIDPLIRQLQHRDDLGKPVNTLDERILDRRAEPPRQRQEIRRRQVLVAEEHHVVVEPDPPDRRNLGVAGMGQVDPADLGADAAGEFLDRQGVGHFRLPREDFFL